MSLHQYSSPPHCSNPREKPIFKVIVLGDSGVGKTCLTFRFCTGHFPEAAIEATIGVDFRERLVRLNTTDVVKVQLWDTAGQERFRKSMVSHYYRNVAGVVLVYDVTRRDSYESLAAWIEECEQHGLIASSGLPMIVVGNKAEMSPERWTVATYEAQRFSDCHGMPLFETSALDDHSADHVEAIFTTLAHKMQQRTRKIFRASDEVEERELSKNPLRRDCQG